MKDSEIKHLRMKALSEAADWMITDAIATALISGKDAIADKLFQQWTIKQTTAPQIEGDRFIARFHIKSRGINYVIICVYREEIKGKIYEYWINKVGGPEWADVKSRVEFIIAVADHQAARREILKKSSQFIEKYAIDSNSIFELPIDDLSIVYDLKPWHYADSYEGAPIADIRLKADSSGAIYLYETNRKEWEETEFSVFSK